MEYTSYPNELLQSKHSKEGAYTLVENTSEQKVECTDKEGGREDKSKEDYGVAIK